MSVCFKDERLHALYSSQFYRKLRKKKFTNTQLFQRLLPPRYNRSTIFQIINPNLFLWTMITPSTIQLRVDNKGHHLWGFRARWSHFRVPEYVTWSRKLTGSSGLKGNDGESMMLSRKRTVSENPFEQWISIYWRVSIELERKTLCAYFFADRHFATRNVWP